MSMFLSLGSIGLGLVAWLIPLIFISSIKKKDSKDYGIYAIGSFTACAVSIGLQIFEIKYRASIGDFSAIDDTIDTLSLVVVVFIIITVALNFQSYKSARKK